MVPTPSDAPRIPRVLVTGFGIFPGAPLNPTERLIPLIEKDRLDGRYRDVCQLQTAVLPVSYERVPSLLSDLCAAESPDIAIHFGLSGSAPSITLETRARNETRPSADAEGYTPPSRVIEPNGPTFESTLPLSSIQKRLDGQSIPSAFSDDAGGYLCNFIFYLSRSGLKCDGFRPEVSGFIHVPLLSETWTVEKLLVVARIAIEESCVEWTRARNGQKKGSVGEAAA